MTARVADTLADICFTALGAERWLHAWAAAEPSGDSRAPPTRFLAHAKNMQRRLVGVISLHAHSLCTLLTGLPGARFCMCVRRYRGLAREAQ